MARAQVGELKGTAASVVRGLTTGRGDQHLEGIGPAGHQAPEDQPDAIGKAVSGWLDRHRLLPPTSPSRT